MAAWAEREDAPWSNRAAGEAVEPAVAEAVEKASGPPATCGAVAASAGMQAALVGIAASPLALAVGAGMGVGKRVGVKLEFGVAPAAACAALTVYALAEGWVPEATPAAALELAEALVEEIDVDPLA